MTTIATRDDFLRVIESVFCFYEYTTEFELYIPFHQSLPHLLYSVFMRQCDHFVEVYNMNNPDFFHEINILDTQDTENEETTLYTLFLKKRPIGKRTSGYSLSVLCDEQSRRPISTVGRKATLCPFVLPPRTLPFKDELLQTANATTNTPSQISQESDPSSQFPQQLPQPPS